MIELLPLQEENLHYIVEWNNDKGSNFLCQWAGPSAYSYPITEQQIKTRLEYSKRKQSDFKMYQIMLDHNTMIGTVELFNIEKHALRATMGRFLLAEEYRGKGYGQQAIKAVFRIAKNLLGLEELRLNVFEYNIAAQKCYEKSGFVFDSIREDPKNPKWNLYSYVIELYAIDIETGKRLLPDVQPEYKPEQDEPPLDIYTH
ncbi:GNAT family N-acetyltransferase [Acetanaerobacterium elongatum]|uniref:Protein N-acetyltransferase, RimJ/RimL family n=1 Tax=Acetanaerobacterium elongatum TaxID=258515 RepID=A0A1H0DEL3_9FIRM|nr:GNAT family protein [Acetanaerobacterium elongatum]SDN68600.1 Protein N-acetyltransferase, RimJ/RimL family [Acetanaerobacterium elongatum]